MSSIITIGGDLVVGRIGFGAMQLTGKQVWGEYPDRDGAITLLRAVVDAGVNFIDTADVYGPHTNELLIREALYPYPDGLVIATKGGFVRGGYDYSTLGAVGNPNYLRQSAHLSARRLGVDQLGPTPSGGRSGPYCGDRLPARGTASVCSRGGLLVIARRSVVPGAGGRACCRSRHPYRRASYRSQKDARPVT